jgi:hypothetical protein
LIGRKTRQFLRKVFSAGLASKQQKNPTPCNITLPKAREAAMAENGTHETGLSKTISNVERGRCIINGELDLNEFVTPREVLAHLKA